MEVNGSANEILLELILQFLCILKLGLHLVMLMHLIDPLTLIIKNSKKEIDLPHMLVGLSEWEKIISNMGINNDNQIVIYDNSDVISSCRCWYNFIYYGHDPN